MSGRPGATLAAALCLWSACSADPPAPAAPPTAAKVAPSTPEPPAARPAAPSAAVAPAAAPSAGAPVTGRAFGAPLAMAETLDVAQVLREPEGYLGKVIQCSGVVARVCERAGCWLELRPSEQASAAPQAGEASSLRVPMAGHRFFIPQDAVGRPAVVEGELVARALGAGERAHLESEGLKAIGPLSLSATGVVIR